MYVDVTSLWAVFPVIILLGAPLDVPWSLTSMFCMEWTITDAVLFLSITVVGVELAAHFECITCESTL